MGSEADELVALGAFAGAQVLVVCLSVVVANAYRERALLVHAAATMMGVLAIQLVVGGRAFLAESALLAVLAIDGMHLREIIGHAGALRQLRRWLIVTSVGVLPLMALLATFFRWHLLLPGTAAWLCTVVVIMSRMWLQSRPWVRWLAPAQLALAVAAAWLGWRSLDPEPDPALPVAALLTAWSACQFVATSWRNRIFGETRLRVEARNTVDPLTGLLAPLIFYDRVGAARTLMRRYGHPSVVLIVAVDNLSRLAAQHGPEAGESALLVAANRVRQCLRDGDVAARVSHSRIAVLAEGMGLPEASANLATRILAAGLREPLPAAPADFLQFRIVMASVPFDEIAPKALLQKLFTRMDDELEAPGDRRIVTLGSEDVIAAP